MSGQPLPDARQRFRAKAPVPDAAKDNQAAPVDLSPPLEPEEPATTGRTYPFSSGLLAGEVDDQATAAEEYFLREIEPQGGVESMLVYSIVDHSRQLNLLENSKTIVVRLGLCESLIKLMSPALEPVDNLMDGLKHQKLVNQWALGGKEAELEIRQILRSLNINLDRVLMHGYALAFDKIGHLDVLIDRLERRRDRALRTLEYTRANRPLVDLRRTQLRRMNLALAVEESRCLIEGNSEVPDHDG